MYILPCKMGWKCIAHETAMILLFIEIILIYPWKGKMLFMAVGKMKIDISIYIYILHCYFFNIGFMAVVIWELSLFLLCYCDSVKVSFDAESNLHNCIIFDYGEWRKFPSLYLAMEMYYNHCPQRKYCYTVYHHITWDSSGGFYFLCLYQYCWVTTMYLVFFLIWYAGAEVGINVYINVIHCTGMDTAVSHLLL